MERAQGIASFILLKAENIRSRFSFFEISIFVIILFHLAGVIGLSIGAYRPLFLAVVPAHLLLMFFILVYNQLDPDWKFLVFLSLIFLFGFFAEWIGIHTNFLFGDYYYGKTLGCRLAGVPLVMCINWFLLIYVTGVSMARTLLKNKWMRIFLGALVLVLLDVLIEPIAMRFDYWHWEHSSVPVLNYVSWFVLSFFMLYLFELFKFKNQNLTAPVLLLSQFIFFIILNAVRF